MSNNSKRRGKYKNAANQGPNQVQFENSIPYTVHSSKLLVRWTIFPLDINS